MELVLDHLKTQEMCDEAVHTKPPSLAYVPDHFKTQEICNEAMCREPYALGFVPDHLKTEGMSKKAIEKDPSMLKYVTIVLRHRRYTTGLLKKLLKKTFPRKTIIKERC